MPIKNFKDSLGNWARLLTVDGKSIQTQSGSVWYDMRTRCNANGSIQKRQPRYIGCTMSTDFCNFQYFAEWHIEQIGFGIENYEIDKDILFEGNKLYSRDTCILVPYELNMFLVAHNAARGIYPQGVFLDKRRNMFQSRLFVNGKCVYLGAFKTPELAHAAFKVAKEAEARRWASRLIAGEFVVDKKVIERMQVWTLPEEVL